MKSIRLLRLECQASCRVPDILDDQLPKPQKRSAHCVMRLQPHLSTGKRGAPPLPRHNSQHGNRRNRLFLVTIDYKRYRAGLRPRLIKESVNFT